MHCPRCGDELKIYEEKQGYSWLYRQYPCLRCKTVWDWKSKIRHKIGESSLWILEECPAWKAVGFEILKEANVKEGNDG